MEQNAEKVNVIIISNNPNAAIDPPSPLIPSHDDHDHEQEQPKPTPQVSSLKKKKNIFKVALFMMQGRHRKSKVLPIDEGSRSIWRKLVGSMRPMHLQDNKSPLQTPHQLPNSMITNSPNSENTSEIMDGFDSASEFTDSPSPASSRYASAIGLNEMVEVEDEEKQKQKQKEEEINVMVEDDEMIDVKAEEFIAQFYREMKLQRLDITDRHYREISMRSLGL